MHERRGRARPTIERNLRMALEHVAAGQRLVDRQRTLLTTLAAHGHSTRMAKQLLLQFESAQAMHVADRDRLIDELARCVD